ncbi:MAG: arsenate reductase ArsC, partial [Betaproteobacteria bacterium]
MYNILFLCTHNSARSVLGEVVALSQSKGMFKGFSAGSDPSGKINPFALEIADELGVSRENLYSKSWDEFAKVGSPQMDFIITVCDNAANEVCPIWPGN